MLWNFGLKIIIHLLAGYFSQLCVRCTLYVCMCSTVCIHIWYPLSFVLMDPAMSAYVVQLKCVHLTAASLRKLYLVRQWT